MKTSEHKPELSFKIQSQTGVQKWNKRSQLTILNTILFICFDYKFALSALNGKLCVHVPSDENIVRLKWIWWVEIHLQT